MSLSGFQGHPQARIVSVRNLPGRLGLVGGGLGGEPEEVWRRPPGDHQFQQRLEVGSQAFPGGLPPPAAAATRAAAPAGAQGEKADHYPVPASEPPAEAHVRAPRRRLQRRQDRGHLHEGGRAQVLQEAPREEEEECRRRLSEAEEGPQGGHDGRHAAAATTTQTETAAAAEAEQQQLPQQEEHREVEERPVSRASEEEEEPRCGEQEASDHDRGIGLGRQHQPSRTEGAGTVFLWR